MSNPMVRRMLHTGDGTMGEARITQGQVDAGMFVVGDDVYYRDGTIAYGPSVLSMSRPRTGASAVFSNVNTPAQLVTLPNGQQVTLAQYQTLLAQQAQQPNNNLLSGGVNSGGVQIGNTNISWPLIMVAVVGLVLLQSRPYGKK